MRHVWPLQCKWDLNMELAASSQAQCDCCICVYDCLSVSFIPRSNWHAMSTRLWHYCLSFSSSFISWAVWAVLISTHRKNLPDGAWAGWTNSGWSNYVLRGRQGHRLTVDDGLQPWKTAASSGNCWTQQPTLPQFQAVVDSCQCRSPALHLSIYNKTICYAQACIKTFYDSKDQTSAAYVTALH